MKLLSLPCETCLGKTQDLEKGSQPQVSVNRHGSWKREGTVDVEAEQVRGT